MWAGPFYCKFSSISSSSHSPGISTDPPPQKLKQSAAVSDLNIYVLPGQTNLDHPLTQKKLFWLRCVTAEHQYHPPMPKCFYQCNAPVEGAYKSPLAPRWGGWPFSVSSPLPTTQNLAYSDSSTFVIPPSISLMKCSPSHCHSQAQPKGRKGSLVPLFLFYFFSLFIITTVKCHQYYFQQFQHSQYLYSNWTYIATAPDIVYHYCIQFGPLGTWLYDCVAVVLSSEIFVNAQNIQILAKPKNQRVTMFNNNI
jgi:hypothetical protein